LASGATIARKSEALPEAARRLFRFPDANSFDPVTDPVEPSATERFLAIAVDFLFFSLGIPDSMSVCHFSESTRQG
jgi:hypothetical protein